ncbi:MAG TPA: Mur ligase family protein [Candidatus Binataceae bacterium]|jgi:UDP-N-acetylmuramate: L-alanyl-gamma-D-glutamyl-meso-diaminopimelate ligase|nr:Mur ligase family protein [Candidatus Binataceae bacterium]
MDPTDSAVRLSKVPAACKRIHLMGVGGTAMAALAGMLKERGFAVSGSDNELYEPTASLLRRLNIDAKHGFAPANLEPPPDLVVFGNVITRNNPEAVALMQSAIPYLSMPEALWRYFLSDRCPLMVCGTHGKTTSTSLMAQVLIDAGRDPGVLIGGVSLNLGSNYYLGAGRYFAIEGDEYDTAFFDKGPKFLHYRAQGAILTSLEFDHADIYRDLAHVKAAFEAMVLGQDKSAVLAVCADYPAALEVAAASQARRLDFGLRAGEFRAAAIRADEEGTHFSVMRRDRIIARDLLMPLWGIMNVANALGVYVLLREFGLEDAEIGHGLASFKGVARRQELVGEAGGVTVIDDFAHHPTAIAATLAALADRYPGRRILAAFEPRSNTSRRNVFQSQFARAFARAARVYLAPVYFKENDQIPPNDRLATDVLAREITSHGPAATACTSNQELLESLITDAKPGDVIAVMSNGPFDNLKTRLLEQLRQRS